MNEIDFSEDRIRAVETDPQKGVIGRIATYIEIARDAPVPAEAREPALKCILDVLASVGAGLGEPGARAIRAVAGRVMGSGDSPIWFTGTTGSPIGAAWANSMAASILDLDDGVRLARGHPGAAVIPAAFAVGREVGASFEQILSAIVIGYEVGTTIGNARLGYGTTGTWSTYAVVATAAALRRTPRDHLLHALAIAGESSPVQKVSGSPAPRIPLPEGSDVKEGIPWSVVTGLVALELAQEGHTGPRHILDSIRYYRFPEDLALGRALHIRDTYYKLYCCCRHLHAPLDALLGLVDRHGIDADAIDAIDVETHAMALRLTNKPDPDNLTEIQYSHPYCLALAARFGSDALLPLTGAMLKNAEVTALAGKVTLHVEPDYDAAYPEQVLARVAITCGERRFVSDVTSPRGEGLSWAELEQKFRGATRLIATAEQQAALLDAIVAVRAGDPGPLHGCLSAMSLSGTA